jgi:hypothetical protein
MPPDLITVFRVFVSGQPHIFEDVDSAVSYLRSQAKNSQALDNGLLVLESAQVPIDQYRLEVEKQDGGNQ